MDAEHSNDLKIRMRADAQFHWREGRYNTANRIKEAVDRIDELEKALQEALAQIVFEDGSGTVCTRSYRIRLDP